jgi:hypothetical protein
MAVRGAVQELLFECCVILKGDIPSLKTCGILDICCPAVIMNW